jgi:hypothetical protein
MNYFFLESNNLLVSPGKSRTDHLGSTAWISRPRDMLEGLPALIDQDEQDEHGQAPIANVDVESKMRMSPARKPFSMLRKSPGVSPAW